MSREDAKRGADFSGENASAPSSAQEARPALTPAEKAVLDVLIASPTSRTAAQVAAGSGLPRPQVAAALETLRQKGLVARYNTLVESYAARFPGVEV